MKTYQFLNRLGIYLILIGIFTYMIWTSSDAVNTFWRTFTIILSFFPLLLLFLDMRNLLLRKYVHNYKHHSLSNEQAFIAYLAIFCVIAIIGVCLYILF